MSERMSRPDRQRSWLRSAGAAALAASAALALSACTTVSDEPAAGTVFVTPAPPGASALPDDRGATTSAEEATEADVAFLAAMVVHHEQAVELTELAASRAGDEELADLASRMRVTQAAEAAGMRSWLEKRRGDDLGATDHAHDAVMRGEISRSTLDRAAELDGHPFDELFLAAMVPHHRGAVEMAEARLAEDGDPAVARWARAIATAQSLEIERMLEIEARLAGAG